MQRATNTFKQHDDQCPVVTHIRKTATGDVEITRRKGLIPEAITATFSILLGQYVHNYNIVRNELSPDFHDPENPPALRTNAARIAKVARCTDRTVRNHLTRLKKLGLLRTKFHGRKRDFELWINTDFLFGEPVAATATKTLSAAPFAPERKNFPLTDTQGQKIKTENDKADMFISHGANNQGQKGKTNGEPSGLEAPPEEYGERYSAAAAAERRRQKAAESAEKRQKQADQLLTEHKQSLASSKPKIPSLNGRPIDQKFAEMLAQFWCFAMEVIYPHYQFDIHQQEKALSTIMEGVYGNFREARSAASWRKFHVEQLEKLAKAGRYFENHPDKYAPSPYSVYLPGKGYFDLGNSRGFAGVDAWMELDRQKKRIRKNAKIAKEQKAQAAFVAAQQQQAKQDLCEKQLRQAAMDFERLERGAIPRKIVTGMGLLQLFQYHSTIFAGHGSKWHNLFLRQFEAQKANNFRPPRDSRTWRTRKLGSPPPKTDVVYVESYMEGDGQGFYSSF